MKALALPLLAMLPLAACVAPPPAMTPVAPVVAPARFDAPRANGEGDADARIDDVRRWWTAWGDPALDRLVERALTANHDIRIARANVAAARAMVAVAESALYPTVAAHGAAFGTVSDGGLDGALGTLVSSLPGAGNGVTGGGYAVGLGASWEPDVFGGRHADVVAARALALGTAETEAGARLLVVGDVVENYQQLQGLRRRLALLDASVATAGRLVAYAGARMRSGSATAADVSKARGALETLRAGRAPIEALIDVRRRRLAVLAGGTPEQAVETGPADGLTVPPPPGGQLPSTVLDRRPDVRASAFAVTARAARLRSAKADLLPRFGIQFLGQNGRIDLGGLPGFGGTGGLAGISAWVPVFNAGRLRARVATGDAELAAAMASHDKAVVTALEEVEGAYGLRTGFDGRLAGLQQALATSAQRADQADALYRAGRMTLGDVLQARLSALSDQDAVEQARMAQATATVQLFRALGGGWQE